MSIVPSPSGGRLAPATLVRVASLLLVALLIGCGGDTAQTTGPAPSGLQVSSGTFDVTSQIIFDTCASTTTYSGSHEIQIHDDLSFSVDDTWSGTWDPKTAKGFGESEYERTTVRVCTVTTWTSITVTFSSEDAFTGSITYRRRVSGDCQDPCVTTWHIAGARQ